MAGRMRKTEMEFLAKNSIESGSQLFLSDGEEKSSDRVLPRAQSKNKTPFKEFYFSFKMYLTFLSVT